MFYHDKKLQYKVWVAKPNPLFARMLQQAIGGPDGKLRTALQYLFQAWGTRGSAKYRDMLLDAGTEEMAHVEMLATAVAMNLGGASNDMKEQMARHNPLDGAVMGGMDLRHILSSGLAAMATDANGAPFDGSWIVNSGNMAADMYANLTAESAGRLLETRLWEMTDDEGMKDMLAFLIARDTMHQNQWLAVIDDLGGPAGIHPVPNSFPQNRELTEFNYTYISTDIGGDTQRGQRWTEGASVDGKGEFTRTKAKPYGQEPDLGGPVAGMHAQNEQLGSRVSQFIHDMRGE